MAKRAKNGETFEGEKKTKNYRATFTMVVKKAFLASSIMLIAVSALRFMVMEQQTMHEIIMNFYFLFFGILLALQQLNLKMMQRNFRFLFYHWGKTVFCFFIGCMSLSNTQN